MTDKLIKPIATAMWLLQKTPLTFKQIGDFCGLTEDEVSEMENGFSHEHLQPHDPVLLGQLSLTEIERCKGDKSASLRLNSSPIHSDVVIKRSKKVHTPNSQKNEKVSATLWLIKNTPLDIAQISDLIRYPKKTIENIKNGTHPRAHELAHKDPVMLGLCTQVQLNNCIAEKKDITDKPKRKKKNTSKISK